MWGQYCSFGRRDPGMPLLERMKPTHMASSDSSSSESGESSDSGSESDSDNERDRQKNEKAGYTDPDNQAANVSSQQSYDTKRWSLNQFLPKEPKEPTIITKPPSYEAPPSDKSEDLDEAEKRPADHVISDENPPSNDQEVCKRMSADEFSPPAPFDSSKHPVLSPIKSPQAMKSPTKRAYRKSGAQKLQTSASVVSDSGKYGNTYDTIKNRERKMSQSKASPSVSDCDKPSSRRGRTRKTKPKSQQYVNSMSESDSEVEPDRASHSSGSVQNSPHKSLSISPQKSHQVSSSPGSAVFSNKPLTNSAKRKENKLDKLTREKDSIKLKPESSTFVPEKSIHCDSSKAASKVPHRSYTDSLPVDQILDSFTNPALSNSKPLSPLPNLPHIDNRCQAQTDERLRTSSVRSTLNGNISCNSNGKPAVLVKIDLNLLSNFLCIDRNNPNFLKPLDHDSDFSLKHQKVTSAKSNLPNDSKNRKPQKVLHEKSQVSASKSVPNRTSPSNSASISNDKSSSSAKQSAFVKTNSESRHSTASVHVKKESDIPDFDSLPVREPVPEDNNHLSESSDDSDSGSGSSNGSGSSSSDSESENEHEDSKAASVSPAHGYSAPHHSPSVTSPADFKKRKLEASRPDDPKRRKTTGSKSPVKNVAMETTQSDSVQAAVDTRHTLVPVKRERRNSTSSQHSTNSNLSHASSSSRHKRAKSSGVNKAPKVEVSQDLRACSTQVSSLQSADLYNRSASPALSTKPSPHGKFEPPSQATRPVNGYISKPDTAHNSRARSGYSLLERRPDEDKPNPSDYYHQRAKKFKHQADEMKKNILERHFLYLESALCFLECSLAMERDQHYNDAINMYKNTNLFVTHEYSYLQRDAERNPDTAGKPRQKLSVLCLRIQALVSLKIYMLKKNDTLKLKNILDDNKNTILPTSQPKPPPSAPSPHQTNWNRSTGTPSPMSPTPSPANSVCSVGSVGSDATPSKLPNGTAGQGHGQPPGTVVVTQRIHSITQKYITNTNYLINAHVHWDQGDEGITDDIKDIFIRADYECGPLTLHSSIQHLIRYARLTIKWLNEYNQG